MRRFVLVLSVVALFSGCANRIEVFKGTDIALKNSLVVDNTIKIDQPPVLTIGVPLKNYNDAQEFIIPFPAHLLMGEHRSLRKSWVVMGVDYYGNLYHGTVIIDTKKINSNRSFLGIGKIFIPKRKGINIIILSTRAKYGYGMDMFSIDREKLCDSEYLRSLFPLGVPLDSLPNMEVFDKMISRWNNKRTPFGFLKTPYSDEVINSVAVINTGYTETERRVRDRRNIFSPNLIGMGISWGIDGYQEIQESNGNVPTSGWDFDSPISAEEQEVVAAFLEEARRNAKIINYPKED